MRRVVLTGATGGIGEAIAHRLVSGGTGVVLVARRSEELGRLVRTLSALRTGVPVEALAVDITHPDGRTAILGSAEALGCDALINNAAAPSFGALEELDDAHVASVIATNLVAPIALTRLLLPCLRRRQSAAVLNIGSSLGSIGVPGFCVYGASKAGLRAFSDALRRELSGSSVRVRYLAPRATRTAFNSARVDRFNLATGTHSDEPARVAEAAVRLLDAGPAERFLGFPEALVARLNGIAPGWLDGAFGRHRAALQAGRTAPAAGSPAPTTLEYVE